MKRRGTLAVSLIVVAIQLLAAITASAQQTLLQITGPASNSLATEGQTITITVTADPSVQNLYVIAQGPLPDVQATSSSNEFTLTLPTTIPPGLYNLTAVGTNASGDVESAPLAIDVEPQFYPASISAQPSTLTLNSVGDQFPVRIVGNFNDGSTLDVTHSTRVTYTSNNTQVATVSSSGMITAVGPGRTAIIVQSGQSAGGGMLITVPRQPSAAASPSIISVSPASGIPGATQVTFTGSGFGAAQGSGFAQLGTQNGTIISWSDSQIVATVPNWSRSGVASVNQNGLYSNTVPFSISSPFIEGISPLVVIPGTQITITGSGFGALQGGGYVQFGAWNGTVNTWSDSQLVATVPSVSQSGVVKVYQGNLSSNSVPFAIGAGMITSPIPSTTLTGSSVAFDWTAAPGASGYWLDLGSVAGGNQYYQSGNLGNVLTTSVNDLPTDGSTVYATMYSLVNGQWLSNVYVYTAYNLLDAGGILITPTPGSTLTGSSTTFYWNSGTSASGYWLDLGSTPGGNQYSQSGNLGNVSATTVSGLPTDGSTIYATLYSLIGSQWSGNAYTYTAWNATSGLAVLQTPSPGTTLSGSIATFAWSADANATAYWLDVGSVAGGNSYYQSGNLGNVLTTSTYSLPADGSTIYVTLYSLVGDHWLSTAYTYFSGP
jgi:hypothetical protein